jgi:LPXTG-motif cell wall-anchored protein
MGSYMRRILAVIGVAMLATMLVGTAAFAQAEEYPPPTTVPGSLNVPPTVVVGGEVAVSGSSCGANMAVDILFNGVKVGTGTTDANGNFATSFKVPAGTAPGTYSVVAQNQICVLGASVTVTPAAAALAFTGSSSTVPTLWVGVGLLALGAGLVFVARRRLSGARIG